MVPKGGLLLENMDKPKEIGFPALFLCRSVAEATTSALVWPLYSTTAPIAAATPAVSVRHLRRILQLLSLSMESALFRPHVFRQEIVVVHTSKTSPRCFPASTHRQLWKSVHHPLFLEPYRLRIGRFINRRKSTNLQLPQSYL